MSSLAAMFASAPLIAALALQRDDDGWYGHPGLPDFDEGQCQEYKAWLLAQGLDTRFHSLESEDDTHQAYAAYYEQSECHVREWFDEQPAGEGWFTLSIHDSEDGPQWVWARRIGAEALMAVIHTEALAYDERFYSTQLPGGQRYSRNTFKDNGDPILLRSGGGRSVFCDVDE